MEKLKIPLKFKEHLEQFAKEKNADSFFTHADLNYLKEEYEKMSREKKILVNKYYSRLRNNNLIQEIREFG